MPEETSALRTLLKSLRESGGFHPVVLEKAIQEFLHLRDKVISCAIDGCHPSQVNCDCCACEWWRFAKGSLEPFWKEAEK